VERLLITLLIRLLVIASVASIVVRYQPFRRELLRETRTFPEQFHFALWFAGVFGVLASIRVISIEGYKAVDLGLEGSFLAGLLGGYAPGLLAGVLISIPGMAVSEYLTLPVFAGIGVMGGLLRDFVQDPEDIWRLSPFIELNVWRALKNFKLFPVAFALAVFFAEFLRQFLGHSFPGRIFLLYPTWDAPHGFNELALYLTSFFAITLALKVWNNTRNEIKLEQQKSLLMEARLQALTNQINPHFLFNTLNSVSSLIRTNPEQARVMILKLSRILRRLLRKHEHLSPLRDELDFIDDYLSIERDVHLFPEHMEGGALVHLDGLYYAIGSHLTGWNANPNLYATARSLEGPWSEFKDIAPPESKTYGSQSTMLIKVVGTKSTTVIFMGDIWRPRTQWDSRYLWMPLEIGGGKLVLPEPRQWTLDIATGEAVINKQAPAMVH